MVKYSTSKPSNSSSGKKMSKDSYGDKSYKDRNLAATNPLKEQFEPTDAEPVNQHKRMAGCA